MRRNWVGKLPFSLPLMELSKARFLCPSLLQISHDDMALYVKSFSGSKSQHIQGYTHLIVSFPLPFPFFFPGISSSNKWLVLNLCHRVCFLGNQSGSRKQTLRTWFGNEVLICVKEIRTRLLVTVVWCGRNFWSGATWQSPQTVMLIGKTYS